jgi:TolA-binding protein
MSHGCPHWPECGCGTPTGSFTCAARVLKARKQEEDLSQVIERLQQTIQRQATMIRAQAEEIARLQPLGKETEE